jgi:pentatricopeptide repeat protein
MVYVRQEKLNYPFLYDSVISRLCHDRLVNEAYDLFYEMIVNKIYLIVLKLVEQLGTSMCKIKKLGWCVGTCLWNIGRIQDFDCDFTISYIDSAKVVE